MTCENCQHEYDCDWTPAGENDFCLSWMPDADAESEMLAYTE